MTTKKKEVELTKQKDNDAPDSNELLTDPDYLPTFDEAKQMFADRPDLAQITIEDGILNRDLSYAG